MLSRRSLLRGLIAAPAIVAIGNIMPVKAMPADLLTDDFRAHLADPRTVYVRAVIGEHEELPGPVFKTIQGAIDHVSRLEIGESDVTIDVGTGHYQGPEVIVPPKTHFEIRGDATVVWQHDVRVKSGWNECALFNVSGVLDVAPSTCRFVTPYKPVTSFLLPEGWK